MKMFTYLIKGESSIYGQIIEEDEDNNHEQKDDGTSECNASYSI